MGKLFKKPIKRRLAIKPCLGGYIGNDQGLCIGCAQYAFYFFYPVAVHNFVEVLLELALDDGRYPTRMQPGLFGEFFQAEPGVEV